MAKKKTDLPTAVEALEKEISKLDTEAADYSSRKDAATLVFLDQHAVLKKGDRILLKIPLAETIRLTVVAVGVYTNNLTEKTDIAYSFNDGSMLYHSALEGDGYDWDHDETRLAEAV